MKCKETVILWTVFGVFSLFFFAIITTPKDILVSDLGDIPQPYTGPLEHDKPTSYWFQSHYREEVEVLWNVRNATLKYAVKEWWLRIDPERARILDEVIDVLEDLYISGAPVVFPRDVNTGRKLYKSCAVVGSSDVILKTGYGKEIDKHESVFRFNTAITKGFEKDVGSKTTHRLFYPESTSENINYKEFTSILVPFKFDDVRWLLSATTGGNFQLESWGRHLDNINTTPDKVWIIKPDFLKYIKDSWIPESKASHASTGLIGVIMALHFCDQVSVFGFGANSRFQWGHYYEKLSTKAGGNQHSAWRETEIMLDLHKDGSIKFYSPLALKPCARCELCRSNPSICDRLGLPAVP